MKQPRIESFVFTFACTLPGGWGAGGGRLQRWSSFHNGGGIFDGERGHIILFRGLTVEVLRDLGVEERGNSEKNIHLQCNYIICIFVSVTFHYYFG